MKKLLPLLALLGIANGWLFSQTASIIVPQQSAYGYPWSALAGSDRVAYVTPIAETDSITAWSGTGSVVTFTATNHLAAGDVINIRKMTSPGQFFSQNVWKVVSASPTSFTVNDGATGSAVETTGYLQKIEGPSWTGDGKWEIYTTAGSETFRLYTQDGSADTGLVSNPVLTHVPSHINFTVGPNAGVTSTTGSIATGNFAIHSTIEFDVKFTLDADPTKTAIFHYVVAANGGGSAYQGVAHVSPGYRQVFKDRYVPLVGQVFGNTNQMIDWTITSAPGGGDATLQYATFPQPIFYSGTVSGQYEITGCPHVDASAGACDKLAIWVSPNSPPAANPDKTEQVPCDIDTTANPTVMDIGPSKTYHDLLSVPQSYAGPLLVRVFNESSGSPTEYHNQLQVNIPTSGSWDHKHPAFVLCGVPDPTSGKLPIIDGSNATTNSWTSPYIVAPYGLISVTGISAGPTFNNGLVKAFNHVTISGLHIRNVTTGYNYKDQSGATQAWGGSMGLRPFGIQYWSVLGVYAENVATPFFDDCNSQQSGWTACTLDTFYEGNHAVGYGIAHQSTEHMFYLQAFRDTVLLNLQDGVVPLGEGTSAYSDRGTRSFHMYNRLVPQAGYNTASGPGGHSEIQDAYNYILPDEYWGYQGSPTCATTYSTAPGCSGSYGAEDWFAAATEEHSNSEFTIANAYESDSNGSKFLSIATTHNTVGIDNSAQGFYSYNTFYVTPTGLSGGQFFFEDTRLGSRGDPDEQYLPAAWPRGFLQNNIIPWKDNTSCAYTCTPFGLFGHALFSFQTNMITPGQVTVASNIPPTGWSAGGLFQNGINTSYSYIDGWNLTPINRNLGGFITGNFVPYSTFPIDTTSLAPIGGSDAIGKATTLTGQLAYYPPRFNAVDSVMSPFTVRSDLTTLGAYDPTGPGAPSVTTTAASSITTTTATAGGNVTSDGGDAVTSRGTCYSTSANPTSPCTSDGTGTGAFTSSLTGLTASTTYHIRAFATNGIGTSYGSDLTFTTSGVPTAPTVTTTAASSITDTTAATGGNVTTDGGASVTSRGVCYSTSSNPTSPCTSNGTGTGVFSSSLSGLTASTLYHIRAFATNSVGTSYGSDLTFTTSAPSNSVTFGGNVSFSGSVAIQQ
jgi:hypothetical protein